MLRTVHVKDVCTNTKIDPSLVRKLSALAQLPPPVLTDTL